MTFLWQVRSHIKFFVKHINCHVQRENSVTFLDFRFSEGIAVIAGEVEIFGIYIDNFLSSQTVKEF